MSVLSTHLSHFSVMRIPLPAFHPLHTNPSHQNLFICPPSSKPERPFSVLICLLRMLALLLTPSSSTQPAHSVLWDELWLILPASISTLPSYLPTFLQLSASHPLSVTFASYNYRVYFCYIWGNGVARVWKKKSNRRIKIQKDDRKMSAN